MKREREEGREPESPKEKDKSITLLGRTISYCL
jgi:hypothetical protein